MLVTFESTVGRITMFGDVATQLLRLMGHSGTVPGALLAADVAPALAALKQGVADLEPADPPAAADEEAEPAGKAARVSLRNRAFPLIQLLEDAVKQQSDVLWDQGG